MRCSARRERACEAERASRPRGGRREAETGLKLRSEWLETNSALLTEKTQKSTCQLSRSGRSLRL